MSQLFVCGWAVDDLTEQQIRQLVDIARKKTHMHELLGLPNDMFAQVLNYIVQYSHICRLQIVAWQPSMLN